MKHLRRLSLQRVVLAFSCALALLAIAPLPAQAVTWKRLSGKNSLETMTAIVNEGWGTSNVAVIATNKSYQDALAASALAGANNCPVLMTAPDKLSGTTMNLLRDLGTKTVYLCGGPKAIDPDVEDTLTAMGIRYTRLWGQTSPDTAVEISKRVTRHSSTCILATNANYADALSASSYSYYKRAPIFLTSNLGTRLTDATYNALATGGYTRVIIAGGPVAVSSAVESILANELGLEVIRVGGQNRYDTSALLAQHFVRDGLNWNNMGIATGKGFRDALAGAALCGKKKSPIVLADREKTATLQSVIGNVAPSVNQAYVFGGPLAVSATVPNYLGASTFAGVNKTWAQFLGPKKPDEYAEWRHQWILNRIDNNLSTYDRVKMLQVFISSFPYDRSRVHHTGYDLYKYGEGTCVSASEMMEAFCKDLGIRCEMRDASADVGQIHYNNYVWIDGVRYIVDSNPGSRGSLRFSRG